MNQNKNKYLHEVYPERIFKYNPEQKCYYKNADERCLYPQWKKMYGIHKTGGNFPAMVARYEYEKEGYLVEDDYCLVRKPNQRADNDGHKLLCRIFGTTTVGGLIYDVEKVLFSQGMRRGGDPDLFVYKADFSEHFFVEAKEPPDDLRENQRIVMYLIRNLMCPVYVAKIIKD